MSTPTPSDTVFLPSVPSSVPDSAPLSAPRAASAPAVADSTVIPVPGADKPLAQHRAPRKLTPLERKERDKLRKKEQAKRRLQQLQERDDAARTLAKAKASSFDWHQKEREEEELILRRLERDMVDPQKSTPVAAGYAFSRIRDSGAYISPVFCGYSHALCPAEQQKSAARQRSAFGGSVLPESAFRHPACQGYAMASDHDSTRVSPVFFFSGFAKVPLESVVLANDDDDDDDSLSENELDGNSSNKNSGILVLRPHEREKLLALMNERFRSPSDGGGAVTPCLVCKSASRATVGCPGCFTFSHDKHREAMSSVAIQRLKTPKTKRQEQEDRRGRHKELQRQLVMPPIYRNQQREDLSLTNGVAAATARLHDDFYAHVLVDHHAIRMHRAVYASRSGGAADAWDHSS